MTVTVAANDTRFRIPISCGHSITSAYLSSIFGYAFHIIDGDLLRDSFETGGYAGWPVYLYVYGGGAAVVHDTVLTDSGTAIMFFDNLAGATNEDVRQSYYPRTRRLAADFCAISTAALPEVFNFASGTSYQSNIGFQYELAAALSVDRS